MAEFFRDVFGQTSDIPYWELAELGGEDTMRGFFTQRFLGKGRALVNGEFRFFITDFNFFDIWRIDGVAFGNGGARVLQRYCRRE